MQDLLPYRRTRPRLTNNRWMLLFLILFFILLSCILYLQSPISRIQHVEVTGQQLLAADEVITASGLHMQSVFQLLRAEQIKKKILALPEVAQVDLTFQFPNTIRITIKEWQRIGNWETPDGPLVILENGAVLQHRTWQESYKDKPFIRRWEDVDLLPQLITELKKLSPSLLSQIQSIEPNPDKQDPEQIVLHMRGEIDIHTTVAELSSKLSLFPQISNYLRLQQIEGGVLHLDEAVWYQSAGKEGTEDGSAEEGKGTESENDSP